MKAGGSRKQDIEMFIKLAVQTGDIKRSIDLCQRYGVSEKRYGKLVKEATK